MAESIAQSTPPSTEDPHAKLVRVQEEIAQLVAHNHERLPRELAENLGAIYARYSSRHQDSIIDQIRTLLEEACQKKIYVPAEFIFFDMGVRGYKNDRHGLNALRACLHAKSVKVVLFFATNRLFRKSYIARCNSWKNKWSNAAFARSSSSRESIPQTPNAGDRS